MSQNSTKALVIGVGAERGLGSALAKRFAREGYHVIAAGRTPERIDTIVSSIVAGGGSAEVFPADATKETDVVAMFDRAMDDRGGGPADLVVFNAGNNQPHDFRTLSAADFESAWRVGCFAGFLVGREAARRLVPLGRGTVIFTGASGSLRGRPRFASFAAAKAGLRNVAQAMAREFGPQGVHVAHVIIDGGIDGERLNTRYPDRREQAGPDGLLDIDAIAEAYWQIHRQHRSAWTHEIDLRPYKEPF
jgi:NAD(P)-dependent dehydrogenase (short-subunit alcohol dehydrogenase family)